MGEEVEGAAVWDEADLMIDMRERERESAERESRLLRRGNGCCTYDGVRSDFTPCPFFALAHLLEGVLLREAEDVAGVWFGQPAH